MKIGGFEVGPYVVKESGGKRHLIFDCRNCVYGSSISDDRNCRYHVLSGLAESGADLTVLAEVYERVYAEKQTNMLKEIADIATKFQTEAIWSYSHLGNAKIEGEGSFGQRHDVLVSIAHELLLYDPIAAYLKCLQAVSAEKSEIEERREQVGKTYDVVYFKTLNHIRQELEKTELIRKAKSVLLKLKEMPDTREIYKVFFEAQVKPSFIGSRLMFEQMETFELLDEYSVKDSTVQIFKHPHKTERMYFLNPPEYSLPPEKYFVMSKTKEIVSSYAPARVSMGSVAKSRRYFERIYQATIRDICRANKIDIDNEEIVELSQIVARYTVGYGILEILLSDRKITDIYVDSPIGQKAIYIVHADHGQCQTNVIYTEDEASSLTSKLRAMSGRPFDEAHPVLDFDLQDLETRVAVIGKPLAPDGTAFAFRLHKVTPWTLPQFINVKYMNPLATGLLSFFIDNQSTIIVAGSRGSGKTSLMGSLILEILQNNRILVQEDTLEIPVPYMKEVGFNIQRLKTKSAIAAAATESEVSAEEALRTSLRLGDSAIILGEVRSTEAKTLYEAMRVGAAGNVVMGTLHADSPYSVWDRVVNDLGVPTTSFKATDLVVVARPIRFGGSLKKHRRVVQISEIKKHWNTDPEQENGILDLMVYDAKKDEMELQEDNLKESELFSKIGRLSGLTVEQMWKDIEMRGKSKQFLTEMNGQFKIPQLLEAENTVAANNKLLLIKENQIEEHGNVDYDQALGEWKNWVKSRLIKRLVELKKRAGG